MYWTEATAPAWSRLWRRVRAEVGLDDLDLTWPPDLHAHWRAPQLVLSQTCGLPYRQRLHRTAHLVGTFAFDLPDTPPGYYHSLIVARRGPLPEQPRIAVNAPDSQSGWAALCDWAALNEVDLGGARMITGAHINSAWAVARGEADIAAIDAVTWGFITDRIPVRIVDRTRPTPGLPLITNRPVLQTALHHAFAKSVAALRPDDKALLRLKGFVAIPKSSYLAEALPPKL